MANPATAMTAKVAAAGRARESDRPDRLFEDRFASTLAGPEGFRLMDEWRLPGSPPQAIPTIGPRTPFFDDLILAAMGDGLRQVMLIAAGLDTRAFRLSLPADAMVFELDQGEVLHDKQSAIGHGPPEFGHLASPSPKVAPRAMMSLVNQHTAIF